MNFGERIKEIRKAKGLSQQDVAEKIGIDRAQYSRVETGKVEPNLSSIKKIANALQVDIVDIFKNDTSFDVSSHDKTLVEKLRLIEQLEDEQKNTLYSFIDMAIANKRFRDNLSNLLAS